MGIDLESLMERLAKSGVTIVLKTDHERMLEGGKPWTIVMSGSGMGEKGGIHTDKSSLQECLRYGLGELKLRHADWAWLHDLEID